MKAEIIFIMLKTYFKLINNYRRVSCKNLQIKKYIYESDDFFKILLAFGQLYECVTSYLNDLKRVHIKW